MVDLQKRQKTLDELNTSCDIRTRNFRINLIHSLNDLQKDLKVKKMHKKFPFGLIYCLPKVRTDTKSSKMEEIDHLIAFNVQTADQMVV